MNPNQVNASLQNPNFSPRLVMDHSGTMTHFSPKKPVQVFLPHRTATANYCTSETDFSLSEVKSNGNFRTINMDNLPGLHQKSLSRIMVADDEVRTSASVAKVINRRLQIQEALNLVHGGDAGVLPSMKTNSVERIEEDEISYESEFADGAANTPADLNQYCGELATD